MHIYLYLNFRPSPRSIRGFEATWPLETSVFIERAPVRPSQTSLFIERASFRPTLPCSKHRYLSSGRQFDLRKHRYLSIGRRFGPHRPARNIGLYRVGAGSTCANVGIYRSGVVSVHIILLETSVFIGRASFLSESACSTLAERSSKVAFEVPGRIYRSRSERPLFFFLLLKLFSVHGHARVHTSIYLIFIYIQKIVQES